MLTPFQNRSRSVFEEAGRYCCEGKTAGSQGYKCEGKGHNRVIKRSSSLAVQKSNEYFPTIWHPRAMLSLLVQETRPGVEASTRNEPQSAGVRRLAGSEMYRSPASFPCLQINPFGEICTHKITSTSGAISPQNGMTPGVCEIMTAH